MSIIKGLRTVIYSVDDLSAAKDWYSEVFGIKPYFDESFYVGFNIGGYELGLHPTNKSNRENSGVIAYWGVEDVKATFELLIEKGAKSNEEPSDVGGGILTCSVMDPWNNPVGLIFNPHFKIS